MAPKSIANFHSLFMQRTNSVFRNMTERVKPRPLPFTIVEFRAFVSDTICGSAAAQCIYCTNVISIATVVWDHKTPISRGGSLRLENLGPCCRVCNQTKSELTADEFRFLMGGIRTMPESAQRDVLRRLRSNSALVVQRMLLDKAGVSKKTPQPGGRPNGIKEERSGSLFQGEA